jgi:hypothetical protein
MSRAHPEEQLTSTGIRIVGKAAADLVARAAATAPLLAPEPNDVIWAARFRVRARFGAGSPVPSILALLEERLRADWDACPKLTRDTPFTRPPGKFHGIGWDVDGEAGAWLGELVWRHPHPVLAGTPVVTHLLIEEQQQITFLTICVAADGGTAGVRGMVGAGQARPSFLDHLRSVVALSADGYEDAPTVLSETEVAPFVRDVMLSEQRTYPVAVLAPTETDAFIVPPADLATELLGLAPLFVLERHPCTFRLTDAVGDRRLSAYFGALRVYRADFSCADRSEDHFLLRNDWLDDPVLRAELMGRLAMLNAQRLLPVDGIQARRLMRERRRQAASAPSAPAVAEPKTPVVDATPASAAAPVIVQAPPLDPVIAEALAALPGAMQALTAHLRDLSGTIGQLVATNAQLADEITRLRTTTAIRASSLNAMERRLIEIDAVLRPPTTAEHAVADLEQRSEDADTPLTLIDVVRHASTSYSEALLVLDAAEASAALSPYEDVERVAVVLQAMAYVARRRQEGALGTGLRDAFRELGVDYRAGVAPSTSEKLLRQYAVPGADGRVYDCPEHIALGSSYDPRHCLRIYFTSRAPSEPRFVIGHVGRHFRVLSSS